MKVVHVITGLEQGGAEAMLLKILRSHVSRMELGVISLTSSGYYGAEIRRLGIPLICLEMGSWHLGTGWIGRLFHALKNWSPDLVQTWLLRADICGGVVASDGLGLPTLWNLRNAQPDACNLGFRRRLFFKVGAFLSKRIPKAIVCGSHAALSAYSAVGYCRERMLVIPNGFDLVQYAYRPELRESVRRSLGIDPGDLIIGMVARFDPHKDHRSALASLNFLLRSRKNTRLVFVGSGMDRDNAQLAAWIREFDVERAVILLGARSDVHDLLPAFDFVTLTSVRGEGFPNAIGEAMACGLPCVVTETGDARLIIGETGLIVRPGNYMEIANAWEKMIDLGPDNRQRLGLAARERIRDHFSMESISDQYEDLYKGIVGRVRHYCNI